ncbi:hypothetical protein [Butyrivibrio sp. AE2032]|uniref:hypothetical protein n=1 Tax=Butyrivibrio sp. AE2032 TaxID=1458463 RepID=UPI00054D8CFD|nr:hypothetical protein [Butyrivibrio sp. AE2032]
MQSGFGEQIKAVNAFIESYSKEKQYARNYIHFFRPHVNKPLNIVGSFENAIKLENGRAPSLSANSKCSFGMQASVSFNDIRDEMLGKDSPFVNKDAFARFLQKNRNWFCIDIDEYDQRTSYSKKYSFIQYQEAFLTRCLIASSLAFGYIFSADGQDELIESLKNHPNIIFTQKDNKYYVRGRISDELINRYADTEITVFDDRGHSEKKLFGELYRHDDNKDLVCFSPAIYSGVIPRLCKVLYEEPKIGNQDIYKLQFEMGRTSYMTMYAFNFENAAGGTEVLLNHPFMQIKTGKATYEEINRYFDLMEVQAQTKFYDDMTDAGHNPFSAEIKALNDYLNNSWNIHNVNVSGNVITREDICVYTKRARIMSDPGHLFCSVNGGSEIYDKKVSYYKSSVQEDIPTISYGNDPFYFGGELTREAIAELGLSDNSPYWKYYGFTCMSGYHGKESTHALWLHFNVLGERYCSDSFEQISIRRMGASESMENSEIFGYKLTIVNSRKEKIVDFFKTILSALIEWKDVISIIIISLCAIKFKDLLDLEAKINIVFAVLLIVLLIINFIPNLLARNKYHRRINSKTISAYNEDEITNVIEKIFGDKSETDMILIILTKMRLITLIDYSDEIYHDRSGN